MSLPPDPVWIGETGHPGRWRTDRLNWITTGDLTSALGIDTSEMVADETTWTQEA